jgi:hypothetical protein
MAWIKKNLVLVATGAVALVLLGVAGYFLWSKYAAEADVTEKLSQQSSKLDELSKKKPHPGNEKINNITAAKDQDKKLQEFVAEARKTFVPGEYPTNLESGQLKLLMDNTIAELTSTAKNSGVKLQADYGFTFGTLRRQMSIDRAQIQPLASMLADIRGISMQLFQARILALDGIRRCTVSTLDTPGPEFWNKKPTTNDFAVLVPYEFSIHCFTAELAAVLENLYRCPQAYLVKNIVADPAQSQLLEKTAESTEQAMPMMPMMNSQQLMMMMRYGMRGGRYGGPAMAPPPETQPASKTGFTTMLEEKPFRAILWVETVRLRDPNEVKAAKAARPARTAPAADGTPAPDGSPAPDGQTPAPAADGTTPPAEPPQ